MVVLLVNYAGKLRAMRQAEKLTQKQFSVATGVSLGAISKYESGHQPARAEIMERVLMTPQFQKYTLWLLHGSTHNVARQISLPFDDDADSF
ncbi:helix-turn-helix domain-containing protein [Serratia marcescens]|uniref:helix-turn-helix domain-containing protein n=1 Tax=Serratia marcescens TaxID=615 RepID=UPI0021BDEE6E|nr:helix-turn-helix transcriptional regulator [Serratia marcescens]